MHGQSPCLSACLKALSAAVTCRGTELSLPAHPSTAEPMCCTAGEGAGQISPSLSGEHEEFETATLSDMLTQVPLSLAVQATWDKIYLTKMLL